MLVERQRPDIPSGAAPCRGLGRLFYPPAFDDGRSEGAEVRRVRVAAAKAICWNQCAWRVECLEFALANHERWGIWGGYDEVERGVGKRRTGRYAAALTGTGS